ncbi:endonuclease-reverse transcriptase [Elysia marginata]|uniref:Endonuclease-reverse transcriptase n=1 Tax=Elysia marginata TaxID=1093978 RepID=A0AAV4EI77_9GAST|nr:endonuclease-reverse transcriptase [Elysia marginata]
MEGKATEAQTAAAKGDTLTLFKITRELTSPGFGKTSIVKDKNGKVITREEDQCTRWAKHMKEIFNRPNPEQSAEIGRSARELEMKRGSITYKEIEKTIGDIKSNRAPGEDNITTDRLKADSEMSVKCLVELFNRVWAETWRKGIIVKLPKKGDLSQCGNWKSTKLLSVPGKIFCRVMLCRIKSSIDKVLREEQAWFREGRSCTDQIFVLHTIFGMEFIDLC